MDMVDDTFDVLADISLPELQPTQQYSNIADGPFAVEFGENELALGAQLNILPTGMICFLFQNKMKFIPAGTPTSVDSARQTITFGEGSAQYVLRPLTLADQKYFYPDLVFADLNEFKDFVAQKSFMILGSTEDPTNYAITSEDDGNVLGVFQHTADGFFRREKKTWVKLNKDEESDWDDVDDKAWIPVLSGAVAVYDKAVNSDSIPQSLFTSYIVY